MKKKEVTWADFGENDKITEEMLGLKRVEKMNIILFLICLFEGFAFLVVFGSGSIIISDLLSGKFALMNDGFVSKEVILLLVFIISVVMLLCYYPLNNLADKYARLKRKKLIASVKPIKGKIVRVVMSKHYQKFGRYTHSEWTVFVGFNDSNGKYCEAEGPTFKKDITRYLRSDDVNIYVYPDSIKAEVWGFDFRNKQNPEISDIPFFRVNVEDTDQGGGGD